MEKNLDIQKIAHDHTLELKLAGRIDAYWADHLGSCLEEEIRAGNYHISFNLSDVNYISSIGIRLFIKYYKQLKGINGSLSISEASENVKQVFSMVGLNDLFEKPGETKASDEKIAVTKFSNGKANFEITELQTDALLKLTLVGNPPAINQSSFTEKDCVPVKFYGNSYGVGLGAIGNDFEDCRNRFGECIGLGNVVGYQPTDGTNKPDYMIKTGGLVPEIKMLYGLLFEGEFSHLIRFDCLPGETLPFSQLVSSLSETLKMENFGMLMFAETSGIIGATLNQSPIANPKGFSPFSFPEVRQQLYFTTEPAHHGTLAITAGLATKSTSDNAKAFTRSLSKDQDINGHFHAAIFPFHVLKKNKIDLHETLADLFENSQLHQIVHLVNDERELVGTGESEFVQGLCWIGKINEF